MMKLKKKSPLNIWLLQFAHSYLESHMNSQVSSKQQIVTRPTLFASVSASAGSSTSHADLAPSLSTFLKDCLASVSATSPYATACYFQLFRILHDVVNAVPALVDDKRFVKDIQDVTHKLFELCNSIVALSLQQTTWLRKNYAVRLMTTTNTTSSASTNTSSSSSTVQQSTAQSANPNAVNSALASGSLASSVVSIPSTVTNTSGVVSSVNGSLSNATTSAIVTPVGAGPGVGGTILIHNDNNLPIQVLSASQQTVRYNFYSFIYFTFTTEFSLKNVLISD